MAKQSNQKAKLLYLQKILMAETDAEHGITIAGIVEKLAELGIAAERKSLYDDIEVLRGTGMEIVTVRGRSNSYKLAERTLDAAAAVKIGMALKAAGVKDADAVMDGVYALLSRYEAETVKAELAKNTKQAASAKKAETALSAQAIGGKASDGSAVNIELKCSEDLKDAVLNYFGAQAQIVKTKSSGTVIAADAVINEDFYAQLIKWGTGVKFTAPADRRKEFVKYCKKILGQYK